MQLIALLEPQPIAGSPAACVSFPVRQTFPSELTDGFDVGPECGTRRNDRRNTHAIGHASLSL